MNVILILCDTLRVDHCGPYSRGQTLNRHNPDAPDWAVPTPNMDRFAERGTTFSNCWCGSTPCMPARRDIYTGRYEFLERGWGPLAEEDIDLPRQISGEPNRSIRQMDRAGDKISYLISNHFHLWEQGSGNYHMGYTGFDFVRGQESDAHHTDPVDFPCPEGDLFNKNERHWRNRHLDYTSPEDSYGRRVFQTAADWLRRNHTYEDFFLHLDVFDPHEPWDPPEELVKMFDPNGYDVDGWTAAPPYEQCREKISPELFRNFQARYAAKTVQVDQWLGLLMEVLDELELWNNTLVVLTTDHGTWNGDYGRLGKLGTHLHEGCGHIPLIMCHPEYGHGERRSQLVQLVDLYPTTLAALGCPIPDMPVEQPLHGINLLPVLQNTGEKTRNCAIAGMFGESVTLTDGDWILHQSPVPGNKPLYWYGYHLARFISYDLGPYVNGCRAVDHDPPRVTDPTWLSDKRSDLQERHNLAEDRPGKLKEMQRKLRDKLVELRAPAEQLDRLGIRNL